MNNKKKLTGHILAFFTSVVWGITFVSTKVLVSAGLSPTEILVLRFIVGYFALIVIYPHFMKFTGLKNELMLACAGFTGMLLYCFFENTALAVSQASDVSIIISCSPFPAGILAHFFSNERVSRDFLTGFVFSVIGIILVTFNGSFNMHISLAGDIFALLASLIWGVYTLVTKKLSTHGYHVINITRRMFFYALVFSIPLGFVMNVKPDFSLFVNPKVISNLLFLGIVASGICFVSWNQAIKYIGVISTSVYIFISPIITLVASIIVLGEKLTVMSFMGILLIIAGLFFSERKYFIK